MSHRTMHKCWQELPPLYSLQDEQVVEGPPHLHPIPGQPSLPPYQQQRRARPSRAMSGFKHWITQRRLDFLPPRPPQSITSTQIIDSITAPATPDILQQMSKMVQEFKVFFALTYFAWADIASRFHARCSVHDVL